uniref:Aldehyde dehydrogenase 3 family member B2 n=1 Tax=Varanus komodoensis TaxID=61221 RepID=A0A8D2LTX4_VARKO
GKTRPMEYRKEQLEALGRFLEERKEDILKALHEDLCKPPFEAEISEIALTKNEINNALNNLQHWMKDESVSKNLATQFDSAFIRKDPYGVVLIIGVYNLPINTILVPLVGAIAAGNCVIIKPAESSSSTERLLAEALSCYLDPDTIAVVTGDHEMTSKLLENRLDYIFFTGDFPFKLIIAYNTTSHSITCSTYKIKRPERYISTKPCKVMQFSYCTDWRVICSRSSSGIQAGLATESWSSKVAFL